MRSRSSQSHSGHLDNVVMLTTDATPRIPLGRPYAFSSSCSGEDK